MVFLLIRPALFALDPKTAHGLSNAALKAMPLPTARIDPALASMVAGIDFPGPRPRTGLR